MIAQKGTLKYWLGSVSNLVGCETNRKYHTGAEKQRAEFFNGINNFFKMMGCRTNLALRCHL